MYYEVSTHHYKKQPDARAPMSKNSPVAKLFLLSSLTATLCGVFAKKEENSRYALIRAFPTSPSQLQYLHSLMHHTHSNAVDFWRFSGSLNESCDFMTDAETLKNLSQEFKHKDISYAIIIPNVEELILRQGNRKAKRRFGTTYYIDQAQGNLFSLGCYHSYDEISGFMDWAETSFPHLAKTHIIGYTHEKRPIRLLQGQIEVDVKWGPPVSYNNEEGAIGLSDYPKPSIWLDAGIHAREWISPSTAVIIITELLENYDRDPSVRAYVDQLTWYILPVVNPDGYEFSRASSDPKVRLWRKNRSAASCVLPMRLGQQCCLGVDLNRNFDFKWGQIGGSNDPCDEVYHGRGPFSEPETEAIRRFITSRHGEFVAFISLHSYSQMWLYPYGHKRQTYSKDAQQLRAVALRATQALYNVYKTKYRVGTGADLLYPASGGSEDWAKAMAGIKYSYLLELRPHENSLSGFLLDESEILPTGKETWEGIRCVADAVLSTVSGMAFSPSLFTSL